jgi:hypothetical protein
MRNSAAGSARNRAAVNGACIFGVLGLGAPLMEPAALRGGPCGRRAARRATLATTPSATDQKSDFTAVRASRGMSSSDQRVS